MIKELEELLDRHRGRALTDDERYEQRVSWVRGELMIADENMSLGEADRRAREAIEALK